MTKEQVYAAKEMYKHCIIANAKLINLSFSKDEDLSSIVSGIMKKTKSDEIIKTTLKYYRYYVEMSLRIRKEIWNND